MPSHPSSPNRLDSFLLRLPKVELHVHLEGSLRPATLLALARKNGVELPANDEQGVRRWLRFRDFAHFLEIFDTCSRCLRDGEDFELLALDFLTEQAMQNVVYSEVHLTVANHLSRGLRGEELLGALASAAAEGEKRHGVRMRLIPDLVRGESPSRAQETVEWALAGQASGLVAALGLSGSERDSHEHLLPFFESAAAGGLPKVAHAGETGGADSLRRVLTEIEPHRIGHGIAAASDSELMQELARRQVPLEICPSSNVALGVVSGIESHPAGRLLEAGVCLTVNSDDPPLFHTNLTREYLALHRGLGWDASVLTRLALNGVDHALLPTAERRAMAEDFRRQSLRLAERYLEAPLAID